MYAHLKDMHVLYIPKSSTSSMRPLDLLYAVLSKSDVISSASSRDRLQTREDSESESEEVRDYEWFVWIDANALVMDMTFEIRFDEYSRRNDVIVSYDDGIVLVRNTATARKIFEYVIDSKIWTTSTTLARQFIDFLVEYPMYRESIHVYKWFGSWSLEHEPKWHPFVAYFEGCELCPTEAASADSEMSEEAVMERKKRINECLRAWAIVYLTSRKAFIDELRRLGLFTTDVDTLAYLD